MRIIAPTVLIRAASLLVPFGRRREWLREWNAEIEHAALVLSGDDREKRLREFAWGSFQDAACCLVQSCGREGLRATCSEWRQSGGFCLTASAVLLLGIVAASGLLPVTQAILRKLPYADADRIATVTQGGMPVATRTGVHESSVREWKRKSKLLDGVAGYFWSPAVVGDRPGHAIRVMQAQVDANFFDVLGVRPATGRVFHGSGYNCGDCVVVSAEFWKSRGQPDEAPIVVDGLHKRVIGVLAPRFWFFSRDIAIWSIAERSAETEHRDPRVGVVVRLEPDVTPDAAQAELNRISNEDSGTGWDTLVQVAPVTDRVRSVFGSFGMGLILAAVMVLATLRPGMPVWNGCYRMQESWRAWWPQALFFTVKTVLLLTALLLAGIEFTRASSITMLGGTDTLTEPFSTWMFLLGSLGVLSWSVFDQRRRCRVCLRRLGLAAQVGCPGCLLLDWAGTELVCVEGHGMLHVADMAACWQESEKWTALDDSWRGLFNRVS